MREIKFRAWEKHQRKWVDIYGLKFQDNGIWVIRGDGYGYSPDDIALMQYTGLKDKNGVEIYEGDIVKHFDYTAYGWSKDPDYWLIGGEFKSGRIEGKAVWGVPLTDTFGLDDDEDYRYLEVIFNIYENPELLKEW